MVSTERCKLGRHRSSPSHSSWWTAGVSSLHMSLIPLIALSLSSSCSAFAPVIRSSSHTTHSAAAAAAATTITRIRSGRSLFACDTADASSSGGWAGNRRNVMSSRVPAPKTMMTMMMSSSGSDGKDGSEAKKTPMFSKPSGQKGKLLVLGGSGFLGQFVSRRAILEGYSVTSLSRRGKPPEVSGSKRKGEKKQSTEAGGDVVSSVDYRTGDARDKSSIQSILDEGGYVGIIHSIGLLFDRDSGLANLNRLVSGSGSVPDKSATYDDITRLTAFNAIEAAEAYVLSSGRASPLPFVFSSAAEVGWPDVPGGKFIENNIAPGWLRRYLNAKRAVEERMKENPTLIRPIIFRSSLIYSLDKIASLPPVGAFFVGNKVGLPFVDRPVTVQALSCAMVRSIGMEDVKGVLRYSQVDELSK